ncbi:MAG TPA: NFACT family protein [Bacillota bacterium]|nr:NFACT family protein [Bacillota bacterium]
MPYDAVTMAAAVQEIAAFEGGRIERIYQFDRHELVMSMYLRGRKGLILCSASPDWSRAHVTATMPSRPPVPPAFCMLLRRHLEGRRLLRVTVVPGERIMRLTVASRDDLGEPAERELLVEAMGQHSNIILLHPDGRIADAIRRVGPGHSRFRQVLPGVPYHPPPPIPGKPLGQVEPPDLLESASDLPLARHLTAIVRGGGPTLARQACLRAGLDPGAPAAHLDAAGATRLVEALRILDAELQGGRFIPNLLEDLEGNPIEFWVFPLLGAGSRREFTSTGSMLDHVYDRMKQRAQRRRNRERGESTLHRELARVEDLLADIARQTAESPPNEEFRRYGELLTANLYRLKGKLGEAVLEDPADPGASPVVVRLDPRLTPAENAQAFFDRHGHARRAEAARKRRYAELEAERSYLAAKLDEFGAGADGGEVLSELADRGYRAGPPSSSSRRREPPRAFSRYRTSDGMAILVGRNSRENDDLTFRDAAPGDLWFHAREIPGSHVILKTARREASAASIRQAAELAAWHSQARRSGQVPVDYTERRNVRRRPGGPPGKVTYTGHRTVYVTPSEVAVVARRDD